MCLSCPDQILIFRKLGDNGNFEEITTEDRESYDRGHVEDDFAQEMCNPNT